MQTALIIFFYKSIKRLTDLPSDLMNQLLERKLSIINHEFLKQCTWRRLHNTRSDFKTIRGLSPLLWVFLKQSWQQRFCLRSKCTRKTDLIHEDQFKEFLMILVVEGQPAAHHLVHDYTQPPPVHRPAIIIVLKNLRESSREPKVRPRSQDFAYKHGR